MEIFIGIFGLIIAIATFWYSFKRKPKEELQFLKLQFRSTQKLLKDLQIELEDFINKNLCSELEMFPNISFSCYLSEMKSSSKENLSEELYDKIDEMELTKPIIKSMTKSLENQFNELQKIQTELSMRERNSIIINR